jgi:hypothetical protein
MCWLPQKVTGKRTVSRLKPLPCATHSLVDANSYKLIEPIDEQTFGLNNEYWLSYYIGREIFDKKFIFLPESIVDDNFIKLPVSTNRGL